MIQPPALFGHEIAGVVEEVGEGVVGVAARDARGGGQLGAVRRLWLRAGASAPACATTCCSGTGPTRSSPASRRGSWSAISCRSRRDTAFRDAALVEPLACVVRGIEASRVRPGQTRGGDRLRGDRPDAGGARAAAGRAPSSWWGATRIACAGPWRRARRLAIDASAEPDLEERLRSCGRDGLRAGRRDRGGGTRRDGRARDPRGPQGRPRQPVRGLSGGRARGVRRPAAPLRGAHGHLDLPPHAGELPRGAPPDRGGPDQAQPPSSRRRRRSKTCPRCCGAWPRGGDGLKTAILPWGQ